MRKLLLLRLCAASALLLPMCDSFDGPPPVGQVKAVDPEADALMAEAKAYQAEGKASKARSSLKEIVRYHKLAPNAAEARYMLGQSYESTEDYRDAFKEYGKLIDRYPQSDLYESAINRQLSMAMDAADGKMIVPVFWGAWNTTMESSVVVKWLREIVEKAPYNDTAAHASAVLAKFLEDQGRPEEARLEYAKLVERYPDSKYAPDAQLKVASLWASSHTRGDNNLVNLSNAREAYEEFTLRFPKHAEAGKARAEAARMNKLMVQQQLEVGRYYLERSNEYTSAIFCFEDVIRQKKLNPEAAQEAESLLARAKEAAAAAQANTES
ncbi:MAG: tetratricopeptide repeat protein [Akkermansia sp.]|nr:tetratricopeptide repeat protein [Akkermansia sp.]